MKCIVDVTVGLHSKDVLRAQLRLRDERGMESNVRLLWGLPWSALHGARHAVLQRFRETCEKLLLFSVNLVTDAN